MVTERMIINALILAASFILVPFIISESLTVDYLPMLILVGAIFLVIAFFLIKENLAISPCLGGSVLGTMNFLPLPLNATHIACIFLILYYITGYVIIRQKPIKLGKSMILWPLATISLIVFYHNHSLSLASMGGSSEGAKPAILMYLVILGYFCAINLPSPSVRVMSRIPFYAIVATALSSVPYLLTTVVPGLAPYLYAITDNVNVESYVDSVTGSGSALSKLSAFGPLGSCLQLYVIAHYPMGTWLRPDRWWVAILSLFCLILVASSGYRSDMFAYLFTFVVGACCYYSWRAIFLPVAIVAGALILLTASSNGLIYLPVRQLPFITQRTLSFLPGDWDPDAVESGKSSNEFRENIQDVYVKEYLHNSPLIGNGFTIDVGQFSRWSDVRASGADAEYAQAKLFIEGKMFHTGWMSVYDCVGIIGSIGFVGLAFNLLRLNARFLFGPNADKRSSLFPLYVWIFCNLVTALPPIGRSLDRFPMRRSVCWLSPWFCLTWRILRREPRARRCRLKRREAWKCLGSAAPITVVARVASPKQLVFSRGNSNSTVSEPREYRAVNGIALTCAEGAATIDSARAHFRANMGRKVKKSQLWIRSRNRTVACR